jgi:hypothetical protein
MKNNIILNRFQGNANEVSVTKNIGMAALQYVHFLFSKGRIYDYTISSKSNTKS